MTTMNDSSRAELQQGPASIREGYGGGEEMPLMGYAVLAALFNAALIGFFQGLRRSGKELPERIAPGDLLLLGVATHKLSRLITKDWVTSPLRAPFTSYSGSAGAGEVAESSRGSGLRRATGDLFT